MHSVFNHDQYLLQRQVFALTGKFRIFNPAGQLMLYSQQKMFKLREDIRVFNDENCSQELLHIQARQIIDFSAAYDIYDQSMGSTLVGTLRRKGWHSLARDEWEILDVSGQPVGALFEDNLTQAMIRRLIAGSLLPQNYDMTVRGTRVADLRQRFNIFRYELDLDFTPDTTHLLDHRLGIAAAILLAAIEGKQHS